MYPKAKLSPWKLGSLVICAAIGGVYLHSRMSVTTQAAESTSVVPEESIEPIQPIDPLPNLSPKKIALGQKLFNDPRLSGDNQISCATCHSLQTGGTDRKARSRGIHGSVGIMNAPTVLNSGFNFSQFWDGRAETLEKQAAEPILAPGEMGSTWAEVIQKLNNSAQYVQDFREIYTDGIQSSNVVESIAEFERSLSTPNSRFDRYLRHDPNAITTREKEGYRLFKSFGCASCHQGVGVGGNMYQKMGVMVPYFNDAAPIKLADRGRFNVTGDPRDMHMFKVPSLRNVDLTPPYFHDGSAATLSDAVRMMAKYQLSHPLTDEEIESIVQFLRTLRGELDGKPLGPLP